jgi:imidazolonepropionase
MQSSAMQVWDELWQGGGIATMRQGTPYGAIEDAAMGIARGRVAWIGRRQDLPPEATASETHDFSGQWITPGLIDCHTHLVFAGNRAEEFEARLSGDSYEAASRRGGGILSTVRATREASVEALVEAAIPRLARLAADGVTTVEMKSGYGLDLDSELKMLRAARALGTAQGIRVRTSFLGAHAIPPEFAGRADAYIDHLIKDMLPAIAAENLADAVDAFAESIAFSPAQIGRLFDAAAGLGLPVKLHADQLADGGGAALAAAHGALSADHLEYASVAGIEAMARAGTVAVLLPGAYATVGATQPPPIAAMRAHCVPMAVATDCNPGSSPLCSLLMAMNLATCLFRLTPEEALAGTTRNAARALGLSAEIGTLAPGMRAEFTLWDIGHPREIAYWMGALAPRSRNVFRLL